MRITGASVDAPVFPMALHIPAAAWSESMLALSAGTALPETRRLQLTAAMRPLRLQDVFGLIGAAIREAGADTVQLGHWPRLVSDRSAVATHQRRELIVALRPLPSLGPCTGAHLGADLLTRRVSA